jgi:protein-tyrosine phosphatase
MRVRWLVEVLSRGKATFLTSMLAILFLCIFISAGNCFEERWVSIDGVSNFRDIGGYVTDDGIVKKAIIYRSGNLKGIMPAGVEKLKELGIKTVVDLRYEPEDSKMGTLLADADIYVVKLPMKRDKLKDKADFYRRIIVLSRKSLIKLLALTSDKKNLPLVIFDDEGVHEVEVATMFLLDVVGVKSEDRLNDYMLSNKHGAKLKREWGEYIVKYFEEYGGIDLYLKNILKITPAVTKNIKQNLIK